MRREHTLALGKFVKSIEDSRFDCEYDTLAIINEKQKEIKAINDEARKQMTHHQETYVDVEISEEFIQSMKNFQRVLQIQFENTMKQVFISSVEQCKEQLRFAMQQVYESTGKPLIDPEEQGIGTATVKDPEKQLNKADVLRMARDAVMQTRFEEMKCFQFDITLEYDKDKKAIKANPNAENWINAIPQHFELALS